MALIDNEAPKGSTHDDAGKARFSRGPAGKENSSHADMTTQNVRDARNREPEGDIEERRETEQVIRPTQDGLGEGLPKDQG